MNVDAPSRGFLLNVDLDLESSDDFSLLVRAMKPQAYSMERPPGRASFELATASSVTEPEVLIMSFVELVQHLPPDARKVWDGCTRRVFDIGLQSGCSPRLRTYTISRTTLEAALEIGAEIAITIYASTPEDEDIG